MNVDTLILKFIKEEKPDLEIAGLRGLVKTSENEWSFRYAFREGDFLSLSDLVSVHFDGYSKLTLINKAKAKSKKTTKVKKTN